MSDFKPIETQEQFDAMVADRLERAEKKYAEKYGDRDQLASQVEELSKQLESANKQIEEAAVNMKNRDKEVEQYKESIRKYETDSVKTRIANEEGLPYAMVSRLSGETEDEIRKDAKNLVKYMRPQAPPPSFNPEGPDKESTREQFGKWFNEFNGGK